MSKAKINEKQKPKYENIGGLLKHHNIIEIFFSPVWIVPRF